jgi:hypothetical protein
MSNVRHYQNGRIVLISTQEHMKLHTMDLESAYPRLLFSQRLRLDKWKGVWIREKFYGRLDNRGRPIVRVEFT